MNRQQQMEKVQKEGLELFKKKNADYGDAFAEYGTIGVLMRIQDKIKRSMSITKNGVTLVDDESIRDTLIDLHNYAAMGIMLLSHDKESSLICRESSLTLTDGETKEWNIEGSTGNIYKRRCITYNNGNTINDCSCPSYKYCKKTEKICKHIISNVN